MLLLKRQKALMLVLEEMKSRGISSRTFLEKALFLMKYEEFIGEMIKFYSFYPHKFGPFSSLSYDDMSRLEQNGYLKGTTVTETGRKASSDLKHLLAPKIKNVVGRFASKDRIVKYVYQKYPEYSVKSQLLPQKPKEAQKGICSIGYQGRDIDEFLNVLIKNGVTLLIDIRYNSFSMNTSFTRANLERKLKDAGIGYIHMETLGIEGKLRKNLATKEDYASLFRNYKEKIRKGRMAELEEIAVLGSEKKVAILCFEHDGTMCHRSVVSAELERKNVPVTNL